jgi:hypothetical protein
MNDEKIDIDVMIDQTANKLVEVLSNSGLTVGIMMLILGDIMQTLRIQKEEKMMHQADAGKEKN